MFGPRNSGKAQLQKFYLGLVGALGLLKEGSSSSTALTSALASVNGIMTCVEDPRSCDKSGNYVDPTLVHLSYEAGTQLLKKYGDRKCISVVFATTNSFPFGVDGDGKSDPTISRCMLWQTSVIQPPNSSFEASAGCAAQAWCFLATPLGAWK